MRLVLILFLLLITLDAHALIQNLRLSTYMINKSHGFKGVNIMLSGDRSDNANILVAVTGPVISFEIWKKESFYGLWRNSKKFTIPAIFSFLQVSYSGDWEGDKEAILKRMNLDLSFNDFSPIEKYGEEDMKEFNNFIANYYQKNNFLSIKNANVDLLKNHEFKLVIKIPQNIPIGKYDVRIYQLDKKGVVFDSDSASFEVQQSSSDYQLQEFAINSPIKYATIAVLMAVFIGFIIGYLFNGFRSQS